MIKKKKYLNTCFFVTLMDTTATILPPYKIIELTDEDVQVRNRDIFAGTLEGYAQEVSEDIVFDMSRVSDISSTVLGILFGTTRTLEKYGKGKVYFVDVNIKGKPYEIMETTGMLSIINVCTRQEYLSMRQAN